MDCALNIIQLKRISCKTNFMYAFSKNGMIHSEEFVANDLLAMHNWSSGWRLFHVSASLRAVPMWRDQQIMFPVLFGLLDFLPSVCSQDRQGGLPGQACFPTLWIENIGFCFLLRQEQSPPHGKILPVFHFEIRIMICSSISAVPSKIQCILAAVLLVSFNNFEINRSLFNLRWGDSIFFFCFVTTF